jgi:pantoate kinase
LSGRISRAFSPGGISSFFEICDRAANGKRATNLENVGARGGGFGIERGVLTEVSVEEAEKNAMSIYINGRLAPEAETTKTVTEMLLQEATKTYSVMIKHNVDIPVGAGFGSSAAGALTTALAFSKAIGLDLTYNQLGRIAHLAEIKCRTGLGTVGPLMLGGCVLTLEPGAPGIAILDRIPITTNHVVVAAVFGPTPTKEVLSSPKKRQQVNKWGRKTLEAILSEPSLENFLACCLSFAEKTGFMTPRLRELVKLAEKAGAIGAAQNMVGEAIHALTTLENVENVIHAFKQVLPREKIIVARVDIQGARLVG